MGEEVGGGGVWVVCRRSGESVRVLWGEQRVGGKFGRRMVGLWAGFVVS